MSDLALRKPAHQSSNFYNFTADNAVDGNYGTDIQKDTCTHTESNDHSPWWMVDLCIPLHLSEYSTGDWSKTESVSVQSNGIAELKNKVHFVYP